MVIWSVALVVLGGLLGLAMWTLSSTSTEVVAVRAAVDRGELIAADDLVVARVVVDPSLRVVPAADLQGLVGQRAVRDLGPGTLLSPDQVGPDVIPGVGQTIIGVAVGVGRLPAEPLRPGDRVRLVETSPDQGQPAEKPASVEAVVHGVSLPGPDGVTVVVDVVVPYTLAARVADRAAIGRVAIVLDARVR
ncbi:MAG: SAF domain-containing protein [Micropruina sp.]|uniref:SAF domain-containing protein n=1 Tax=Micropruina sp. TaxID=2737536 RepID=UPI0039E61E2A